jgi:elongation factor Ts
LSIIYRDQALEMGKPEKMIDKIVEGKMNKFFKESCLMNQQYVKDPDKTIADYLNEIVAKTGEKTAIKRFARFQVGTE